METKTPILDLQATYKRYVANETNYYKQQIAGLTPETMDYEYKARYEILSEVSDLCANFTRHSDTIQSSLFDTLFKHIEYGHNVDDIRTAIMRLNSSIIVLNSYATEVVKWIDELYYKQKYLVEAEVWRKESSELLGV